MSSSLHACTTSSNCYFKCFHPRCVGVCLLPAALNRCRLFAASLSSRGGAEQLDAEARHRSERFCHGSPHTNIRENIQKQQQNNKHTYIAARYCCQSVMMTIRSDIISITGLIANKVCRSFCCTLSGSIKEIENNL